MSGSDILPYTLYIAMNGIELVFTRRDIYEMRCTCRLTKSVIQLTLTREMINNVHIHIEPTCDADIYIY